MLRRMLLPALLIVLGSSLPAHAQVRFEWKFKAGEKFYVEEVVDQDHTITAFGKKIPQQSRTKRVSEFVVKSADADGYFLEQEILSWHTTSKRPGGADAETHLEQYIGNSRFTMRLLRSGVVVRFSGHKEFMERFSEIASDNDVKLFGKMLTEEALRSPLAIIFDVLPRRPVEPGAQYDKTIAVPVGPLGTCIARSKFTYEGPKRGLDEFDIKGTFTFEPGGKALGDGDIKITRVDLKSPGTKGSVTFDRARGRLVHSTFIIPLSGSMTMENNGKQIDVLLEGSESRTMRLTRTNPHNGSGT